MVTVCRIADGTAREESRTQPGAPATDTLGNTLVIHVRCIKRGQRHGPALAGVVAGCARHVGIDTGGVGRGDHRSRNGGPLARDGEDRLRALA